MDTDRNSSKLIDSAHRIVDMLILLTLLGILVFILVAGSQFITAV